MSRTLGLALVMALFLSACLPGISLPNLTRNPSPATQATESALAIETLNVLPTSAPPPTNTPLPTATRTIPPTPTLTPMLTASPTLAVTAETTTPIISETAATASLPPTPTLTPMLTASPTLAVTAETTTPIISETATTASLPPTGTPASGTPALPTATETLHPRFYGTQPPAIPYGKIVLINNSKREVYVSLQCTTPNGNKTIIEYPVRGKMRISAPAGQYIYVAWVGGQKFSDWFTLARNGEISITFEKNKVKVR